MITKEKKEKILEQCERRCQTRLTQKAFRNILGYMADDFLTLICFMVAYRKYPYHLAYMRFIFALQFFDSVICKNKARLIEEYFFDHIETEDEFWDRHLRHRYQALKEPWDEDNTDRYIRDKEVPLYLSEDICKNVMLFLKLFITAVKYPDRFLWTDTDLWHYACEYLLMDDREMRWWIFGPNGHNLLNLIDGKKDDIHIISTEQFKSIDGYQKLFNHFHVIAPRVQMPIHFHAPAGGELNRQRAVLIFGHRLGRVEKIMRCFLGRLGIKQPFYFGRLFLKHTERFFGIFF